MIQAQILNYLLNSKDSSIITLNGLTTDYFSDYVKNIILLNHIYIESMIFQFHFLLQ